MLLSSSGPRYAKDPFTSRTDSEQSDRLPRTDKPASSDSFADQVAAKVSQSSAWVVESASSSLSSLRSWADFHSAPAKPSASTPPPSPKAAPSRRAEKPRPSHTPQGTTTFTFLLFGATTTAALVYFARTRKAMNRLQAGTSLAFRDARAWRKVALNLAKLNAAAVGKVQNLPLDMMHSAQEVADVGKRMENELEEARKVVARQRAAIREADAAEAARTGGIWHCSKKTDVPASVRTGFSFGNNNAGKHKFYPHESWNPQLADGNAAQGSSSTSNGISFKPASAVTPVATTRPEAPSKSVSESARNLSAREKWCRVAGMSAQPSNVAATPSLSDKAAPVDKRGQDEDWIGDVNQAIQQRDAVPSAVAAEEDQDGDYLLPVSDLSIATGRWTAEDEPNAVVASQTNAEETPLDTLPSTPKYEYPISNQYKDMEDIFMAAWDDGYGITLSKETETPDKNATVGPVKTSTTQQSEAKSTDKLVENEIPIHWLRSADIADEIAQQLDRSHRFKAGRFGSELEAEEVVLTEYTTEEPEHSSVLADTHVTTSPDAIQDLKRQLQAKEEEVQKQHSQIRELSERVEGLQDMCYELEDEGKRRSKALKKQMGELEQHLGLITVWAEGIHRRLGLEVPPMSASLRKPHH